MNLHSEMILKQKELNAAKTAPRYAGSKAGNAVKMRRGRRRMSMGRYLTRRRSVEGWSVNTGAWGGVSIGKRLVDGVVDWKRRGGVSGLGCDARPEGRRSMGTDIQSRKGRRHTGPCCRAS